MTASAGSARSSADSSPREVKARSGASAGDAARLKMEITEILASFDAMHLLALIADTSSAVTPSDSSVPMIPQAVVEYFATILLERQEPAGTANPANTPALRAAAQRAIGKIERLMSLTLFSHMIDSGYAESAMNRISADLAFRDALFRWPTYPDQERRALTELFSPGEVEQALAAELGFTAREAVGLHDTMDQLLRAQRVAHARLHEELISERLPLDPQLAVLGEAERRMLAIAMQLGPDLVDAWTVTETDLAAASGKPWQTCDAFLTLLASRFGEIKGTTLARGRSQVRGRPLVTDDDDRYLPTSVDNALRALRPALEAALPKAVFDGVYQSHRARWVEDRTVDALRRALPEAEVWRNLRFDLAGGSNYETDVLLRIDRLCIVVEVKAGRLPIGARRRDLRQALEGLLGKASEQAGRLADAVAGGDPPPFRDARTGRRVAVDLVGVSRVEAVVVTLEDLGWLASRRDALPELGLVAAADHDVPWVVSVFDLEVIAELAHHSAELTRYIRLRHTLDGRVLAVDELELWLLYLDESIDFTALPASMIMLDGRLARYDDAKLLGRGTVPRLRLQRKRERELEQLRAAAAAGWLERAERVIADAQARRRPTTFAAPSVDGLIVCAPRDRGIVLRSVRDLPVPGPTRI